MSDDLENEWKTSDFEPFKVTLTNPIEFSAMKLYAHDPMAWVNQEGKVFVYTREGEKLDTGVVMPMPLPEGQQAIYEVLRALGIAAAKRR